MRLAPPSPYPLPLGFAGGEEVDTAQSASRAWASSAIGPSPVTDAGQVRFGERLECPVRAPWRFPLSTLADIESVALAYAVRPVLITCIAILAGHASSASAEARTVSRSAMIGVWTVPGGSCA